MKKIATTCILVSLLIWPGALISDAQESAGLNFGADLASRYIWRGINLGGPSPHIQPFIEYTAGSSGLAAGFWGSYGLGAGSAITEADFYISYTPVELFTFTVTDYFFPSDIPFGGDEYFNYRKGATGHTIEGMARFNGTERFPFSVLFAVNLYGADGTDPMGNNYHAKYLEAGYSFSAGGASIETFAGFALDNPDTGSGAAGWYGDSGGLINLGFTISGNISLSEMIALPAFSTLVVNPEAGNIYMVFGLSF